MTGSLIREEGVRISVKISFFFLEFINSPIFLSSSPSHFKKFTYCPNHCCFSTGPSQASSISFLYFVLSLSPPLPERRTGHAVQGCFGFASREDEAEEVQICWNMHLMVAAAAHCCTARAPTHQPAAGTCEHHCLTHTLAKILGSSSAPATGSCWPNDSNILFWAISCLA